MIITITIDTDAFKRFTYTTTADFRTELEAATLTGHDSEPAKVALNVPCELIAAGAVTIKIQEA